LIIGGGYAGFYTAWKLEKKLRRDEAEVVVVEPRPYMTYQPFLPEVVAGSVEARHAAISLRRNLRRTTLVTGMVNHIGHDARAVVIRPAHGPDFTMTYDVLVVTAGAVTRTFDVPGVADRAIGMKHVEEAVAIRDRVLTAFDEASGLEPGPDRRRLLWLSLVAYGVAGHGRQIDHDMRLGDLLRHRLIEAGWQLTNDTPMPVVCATHRSAPTESTAAWQWHVELAERVNTSGTAWVSPVLVARTPAIRACITSWRTQADDIEKLTEAMNQALRMSLSRPGG
jgi:NADH dehydrogenase